LSEELHEAFDFLSNIDFSNLSAGKISLNSFGDFALVFNSISSATKHLLNDWEVHNTHIDIHYVYEGEEQLGIAFDSDIIETGKYDESNDVSICKATGSLIKLNSDRVAIIYPGEVHKAGIFDASGKQVKKVVLKVIVR
jgi:YhcH/YjgK/YiaL family protein